MEKERVIGLGVLDQPVHGAQNVLFGRLAHRVLLVICQGDHIFALVAEGLHQVVGHVLNIVDATPELTLLAKVIDTDQKRLALTGTVGILKRVAIGGAVAEGLHAGGRRWRGALTKVVLLVDILAAGQIWKRQSVAESTQGSKSTVRVWGA